MTSIEIEYQVFCECGERLDVVDSYMGTNYTIEINVKPHKCAAQQPRAVDGRKSPDEEIVSALYDDLEKDLFA